MIDIRDMPDVMSTDLRDRLLQVDAATIGHQDDVRYADRHIQGLDASRSIAGVAVTLRLEGRDSALLHHAIGMCRPGDILVIDRAGDDVFACLGGGVAYAAKEAGIIGAVIDGPATDPNELAEIDFPVWCRGISPVTTKLIGEAGMMNHSITVGGATVVPGDIVLADCSGVVFLPSQGAGALADWAIARQDFLTERRKKLNEGMTLGALSGASDKVLETLRSQAKGQ